MHDIEKTPLGRLLRFLLGGSLVDSVLLVFIGVVLLVVYLSCIAGLMLGLVAFFGWKWVLLGCLAGLAFMPLPKNIGR